MECVATFILLQLFPFCQGDLSPNSAFCEKTASCRRAAEASSPRRLCRTIFILREFFRFCQEKVFCSISSGGGGGQKVRLPSDSPPSFLAMNPPSRNPFRSGSTPNPPCQGGLFSYPLSPLGKPSLITRGIPPSSVGIHLIRPMHGAACAVPARHHRAQGAVSARHDEV